MFSAQEDKAFALGRRMAEAGFSMDDNPFTNLQPRLARRWLDGFVSENALHGQTGWLGLEAAHPPHGAAAALEHEAEPARAPANLRTLVRT